MVSVCTVINFSVWLVNCDAFHISFQNPAYSSSQVRREEINILDLCDYCLIEIFKYLNVFDWSLMTVICKRFKEIASYLFIKSYKNFDINTVKTHSPSLVSNDNISLQVFNAIVRRFGPLIKSVSITPPQRRGKNCFKLAIKTISTHCTKNLRHLHLKGFKIDEISSNYLNSVLNHLFTLCLEKCELGPTTILNQYSNKSIALDLHNMEIPSPNFFNQSNQIRYLSLCNVKMNAQFWNQHIPNLLEFCFNFSSVNVECVINFFRNNPQLQHITTVSYNYDGSELASIG